MKRLLRYAEKKRLRDLGPSPVLLIQFKPSTARDDSGRSFVAQSDLLPDLPAVATARQICDDSDHLVWALGATDSTTFRSWSCAARSACWWTSGTWTPIPALARQADNREERAVLLSARWVEQNLY